MPLETRGEKPGGAGAGSRTRCLFPKDLCLRLVAAAAAKTPKPNGLRQTWYARENRHIGQFNVRTKSTYLPILPTLQMETNDGSAFRQEILTSRSNPMILSKNP